MNYGEMNGHAIGIVMKEAVRRAIETIRAHRFMLEATAKPGYTGEMDDVVTNADKAAQAVYVKLLRESFPSFGIVAEEDDLRVECTHPEHDIWFTVDPLDGTKAMTRRQSHGIGTMISLVCDGEVIAAYVGDVMTREIYGYRPGSDKVHRISDFGRAEVLMGADDRPLRERYVLLRELPHKHTELVRRMVGADVPSNPLFANAEVTGGSIGVMMARLWKGEVGGAVLRPGMNTPWDWNPVLGILLKLGYAIVPNVLDATGSCDSVYEKICSTPEMINACWAFETLIIPSQCRKEFEKWNA